MKTEFTPDYIRQNRGRYEPNQVEDSAADSAAYKSHIWQLVERLISEQ